MKSDIIIFKGIPPAKKNAKRVVYAKGRMLFIPSAQHKAWEEEALYTVKRIKNKYTTCFIGISFYPPDKRRRDMSNSAESVYDILVKAGILKDDNMFLLQKTECSFMKVDKENPRTIVGIEEI